MFSGGRKASVFTKLVLHQSTIFATIRYNLGRQQHVNRFLNWRLYSYISGQPATCASALHLHRKAKYVSDGKVINHHINKKGTDRNASRGKQLLARYADCEDLENAVGAFANMQERKVSSWNVMVRAYAHQGQSHVSLELFDQMLHEGVLPDRITISCILSACTSTAALIEGKQIHARIINCSLESDVIVGTALISMYGKCGSQNEASDIFNELPQRDVVTWNAMLTVNARHHKSKDSFRLFNEMQSLGLRANRVTFISLLDACASKVELFEGKRLHTEFVGSGFELDVTVGTALVSMYGRCGSPEDAIKVFDNMPKRDVMAWTTMITLYAQNGQIEEVLQLFDQMQQLVQPNKITFIAVITVCANCSALVAGRNMHGYIVVKEFTSDVPMGNALVNMYGKCGSLEDACRVFERMPKQDIASWTAIITVCSQHGKAAEAIQLFGRMEQQGIQPNQLTFVSILDACSTLALLTEGKWVHTCILKLGIVQDLLLSNALINMYGKCNSVEAAQGVFDNMCLLDVVSWTAMISAYALHRQGKEALQLFKQMQSEEIAPDEVTLIVMLDVCASQGALSDGKQMHVLLLYHGFQSDMAVETALIKMYSKCSSMENSTWVFDRMCKRDVISWNAMIISCSQHGLAKEALKLFDLMLLTEIKPDKATFVGVLAACNHSGLVERARNYFLSMQKEHGFTHDVDHCVCMIDLLGRAGLLDEAEKMIADMPFIPTVVTYMALLGACRYKVDVERGERAARHVFEMSPQDAKPYVLLSNIYASAGREDDAVKLMQKMKMKGLKRELGQCLVEIKGTVYEFPDDARVYPHNEEIYSEIHRWRMQVQASNSASTMMMMTHDLEKTSDHDFCSEQLALAFGLLKTPPGASFLIIKNILMCPDCHFATKYISKTTNRKIVIRDPACFHHMERGLCSCNS